MKWLSVAGLVVVPFAAVAVGCSSPPSQEELESASLTSSNGANMRVGAADAGVCRSPIHTGVQSCDQCIQARCCTVMAACFANQQCVGLDSCLTRCNQTVTSQAQGQACYNGCTQQFPQGAQLWVNTDQCVRSCAQYCPS